MPPPWPSNPDVRYASCQQLIAALRQAGSDSGLTASTIHMPPPQQAIANQTQPLSQRRAPPARGSRRCAFVAAAGLLAAGLVVSGALVVTMSQRDGSSTSGATDASGQSNRVSNQVRTRLVRDLVPMQRRLTSRVSDLEASTSSFARMATAAAALEREVFRTEGWADSFLSPRSSTDRALRRSFDAALSAHAAYAGYLANLPTDAGVLTSKQAEAAIARSKVVEDAYSRLSGMSDRIPAMPVRRSDHVRLRQFVLAVPTPPSPTTAVEPPAQTPSLTPFFGRSYSVDYPVGWRIEAADVWKGSYFDTTIRSPNNPALMLRVDTSPTGARSLDAAALPVVRALERQPGYQLLAYDRIVFKGYDSIYWEFLVRESGRLLHKVDIFFIDARGQGYGFLTQAPADQWRSWSGVLQAIRESLVPN